MASPNDPLRTRLENGSLHVPRPWSLDALSRLGRLVRKELLEILRDRRTIITLVLMPILLYPLLSLAFQQLAVANKIAPKAKMDLKVGFASQAQLEAQVFHDRMEQGTRHLPAPAGADTSGPAL